MDQNSEVTRRIQEWTELYRQLLQISREQLALTGDDAPDEFELAKFEDLHRRWEEIQSSVMDAESELKAIVGANRFGELFEARALPIIRDIQRNVRDAADWIEQAMSQAGGSIRSVREHRNARRAYGDAEHGVPEAMFFDEKK